MRLAPPCFPVFTAYLGPDFSIWGVGRLTNCLWSLDPKIIILLSSVQKMFHHFSLAQSMCSLANCILFNSTFFFFFLNSRALWGLLADNIASHRYLLIEKGAKVLTGHFRLSLITLELASSVFFLVSWLLCSILKNWGPF